MAISKYVTRQHTYKPGGVIFNISATYKEKRSLPPATIPFAEKRGRKRTWENGQTNEARRASKDRTCTRTCGDTEARSGVGEKGAGHLHSSYLPKGPDGYCALNASRQKSRVGKM